MNTSNTPAYLAYLCSLLLTFGSGYSLGKDVPIDSQPGNYEGADNIHWYQQDSLKGADFNSNDPRHGDYRICNSSNTFATCEGDALSRSKTLYEGMGLFDVQTVVIVDDRLEFGHRNALQSIRKANRVFENSGVPIRLVVAHIETRQLYPLGDLYNVFDHFNDSETEALASMYQADLLFVSGFYDYGNQQCGMANLGHGSFTPVVISACDQFEGYYMLAHEVGHTLGLDHDSAHSSGTSPYLDYGRGICVKGCSTGTVMSYGIPHVPFFSSPELSINGYKLGSAASSDATRAAQQMAISLALNWETLYGTNENRGPIGLSMKNHVFTEEPLGPGIER
ncbi:MAG: reprolysin-like metallopeptidase [Halioglobus sp.]